MSTTVSITSTVVILLAVSTLLTVHAENEVTTGRRCELIQVPMCKGQVSYNATKLPNKFGHTTQGQVYWALQPWWPFIDAGCSDNLRAFLCGQYLPKCVGDDSEPQYPCEETCSKAKVRCKKQMRQQNMRWSRNFKCKRLLKKSSRRCIRPERETKKKSNKEYVLCQDNNLPMCRGIPFSQGSLPNMFLQGDLAEIDREMRQYLPLVESGCSRKLRFFLCGVYMPFCLPGSLEGEENSNNMLISGHPDVPFVVPCRELCQEVYDQCSGEYQQRTHGLPWPGKFHCHRYPSYADRYNRTNPSSSDQADADRLGASVPCTMPPYNYVGN